MVRSHTSSEMRRDLLWPLTVTKNTSCDRMDPQSRVLLHAAHAAMEDAGYAEDTTPSFQRKSFGCYIGAATGDYTDNLRNDIDVYYSPGEQLP